MSKIVIDLQRDCMDLSIPCDQLLLKAYAIAFKLDISSMVDFCSKELYGYTEAQYKDIPIYRKGIMEFEGVDGYQRSFPIILRQNSKLTDFIISHSITEIEAMNLSKDGELYSNASVEENFLIRKKVNIDSNIFIRKRIPVYTFKAVLIKVRKMILEWALELEKNGIYGEELEFSNDEQTKVKNVPSIQIIINGNVSNSNLAGILKDSISNIQMQDKSK